MKSLPKQDIQRIDHKLYYCVILQVDEKVMAEITRDRVAAEVHYHAIKSAPEANQK